MRARLGTFWRESEGLRLGIFLLPAFLLYLFCIVFPLAIMLVYSFWRSANFLVIEQFSLQNYAYVFTNDIYLPLILRSIQYGLIVTAIAMILAFPVAYFLASRVKFGKVLWVHLIIIPLFTSDLIRFFAWRTILGTNGILNQLLISSRVTSEPITFFAYSPTAAVIALVHVYLPFMVLAIWACLEAIDPSLLDAAMDLGASPIKVFWKIVLPLSIPGLVAGTLFVFVPVSGEYFGINIMGGPSGFTIMNAITDQFTSALNWPLGAAMSFVQMLSVGIVVFALLMWVRRLHATRNYLGEAG